MPQMSASWKASLPIAHSAWPVMAYRTDPYRRPGQVTGSSPGPDVAMHTPTCRWPARSRSPRDRHPVRAAQARAGPSWSRATGRMQGESLPGMPGRLDTVGLKERTSDCAPVTGQVSLRERGRGRGPEWPGDAVVGVDSAVASDREVALVIGSRLVSVGLRLVRVFGCLIGGRSARCRLRIKTPPTMMVARGRASTQRFPTRRRAGKYKSDLRCHDNDGNRPRREVSTLRIVIPDTGPSDGQRPPSCLATVPIGVWWEKAGTGYDLDSDDTDDTRRHLR